MTKSHRNARTCHKGHTYYKSSLCPVCPVCAGEEKPKTGFLSAISAPAGRALEGAGISTLQELAACSEKEILQLHGMGPGSMLKLRNALKAEGLAFKK